MRTEFINLPDDLKKCIDSYANPSYDEAIMLRDDGVRLAADPHSENTETESLVMAIVNQHAGVAKALMNQVDACYEPQIAGINAKAEWLSSLSLECESPDTSVSDPVLQLQIQIEADKAAAEFRESNAMICECRADSAALVAKHRSMRRAIFDGFMTRVSYVIEGCLKVGNLDFKKISNQLSQYSQALCPAINSILPSSGQSTDNCLLQSAVMPGPSGQLSAAGGSPIDVTPIGALGDKGGGTGRSQGGDADGQGGTDISTLSTDREEHHERQEDFVYLGL